MGTQLCTCKRCHLHLNVYEFTLLQQVTANVIARSSTRSILTVFLELTKLLCGVKMVEGGGI